MGNKPTYLDMGLTDIYPTQVRNLGSRFSEEDYIPMPLTMRRALVEGKRLRHVKPSTVDVVESARDRERNQGRSRMQLERHQESSSRAFKKHKEGATKEPEIVEEVHNGFSSIEPIVTVVNVDAVQSKPISQRSSPIISKRMAENNESQNTNHSHKSPTLTNRRYSLMDMKTGLKKSKFTLELEEKLRQSKFNLGFDDGLDDWKEFSYRMENPESGMKVESLKKGPLRFGLEGNVGKGLETVCLRDPLQYCAHNCQILGLCSIRSPDTLPLNKESLEPSVLTDEITRKYNEVQSILKGNMEHHKREDCNCDHCMLAYLTEMGFPEDNQCVSAGKGRSPKESLKSGRKRAVKERIRIVENENTRKSIEISVSEAPSTVNSLSQTLGVNSSQSEMSAATSLEEDTTNRRIKRMFQKNNAALKDIYSNRNDNQDDLSKVNLVSAAEDVPNASGCLNGRSEEVLPIQVDEIRRPPLSRRHYGSHGKRSSSSTLNASVSSSLSSVLSYKRVRQIFQSIIERSRARRRPRKNVKKFLELEELGLGEVKNNRWYPSDSKTLSIWHGMHQSIQGIQAEFKKYPMTYLKRLD